MNKTSLKQKITELYEGDTKHAHICLVIKKLYAFNLL